MLCQLDTFVPFNRGKLNKKGKKVTLIADTSELPFSLLHGRNSRLVFYMDFAHHVIICDTSPFAHHRSHFEHTAHDIDFGKNLAEIAMRHAKTVTSYQY